MGKLTNKLRSLQEDISKELYNLVVRYGSRNSHTVEWAIEVPKEIKFYIEDRRIIAISEKVFVCECTNNTYQHNCLPIGEFIDLLEMIGISKQVEEIQKKTK